MSKSLAGSLLEAIPKISASAPEYRAYGYIPDEYVAIRSFTSFRIVHRNMRTRYRHTPTMDALKMN